MILVFLVCGCERAPTLEEAQKSYAAELDRLETLEHERAVELAPVLMSLQGWDGVNDPSDRRSFVDDGKKIESKYAPLIAGQKARVEKALRIKEAAEKRNK